MPRKRNSRGPKKKATSEIRHKIKRPTAVKKDKQKYEHNERPRSLRRLSICGSSPKKQIDKSAHIMDIIRERNAKKLADKTPPVQTAGPEVQTVEPTAASPSSGDFAPAPEDGMVVGQETSGAVAANSPAAQTQTGFSAQQHGHAEPLQTAGPEVQTVEPTAASPSSGDFAPAPEDGMVVGQETSGAVAANGPAAQTQTGFSAQQHGHAEPLQTAGPEVQTVEPTAASPSSGDFAPAPEDGMVVGQETSGAVAANGPAALTQTGFVAQQHGHAEPLQTAGPEVQTVEPTAASPSSGDFAPAPEDGMVVGQETSGAVAANGPAAQTQTGFSAQQHGHAEPLQTAGPEVQTVEPTAASPSSGDFAPAPEDGMVVGQETSGAVAANSPAAQTQTGFSAQQHGHAEPLQTAGPEVQTVEPTAASPSSGDFAPAPEDGMVVGQETSGAVAANGPAALTQTGFSAQQHGHAEPLQTAGPEVLTVEPTAASPSSGDFAPAPEDGMVVGQETSGAVAANGPAALTQTGFVAQQHGHAEPLQTAGPEVQTVEPTAASPSSGDFAPAPEDGMVVGQETSGAVAANGPAAQTQTGFSAQQHGHAEPLQTAGPEVPTVEPTVASPSSGDFAPAPEDGMVVGQETSGAVAANGPAALTQTGFVAQQHGHAEPLQTAGPEVQTVEPTAASPSSGDFAPAPEDGMVVGQETSGAVAANGTAAQTQTGFSAQQHGHAEPLQTAGPEVQTVEPTAASPSSGILAPEIVAAGSTCLKPDVTILPSTSVEVYKNSADSIFGPHEIIVEVFDDVGEKVISLPQEALNKDVLEHVAFLQDLVVGKSMENEIDLYVTTKGRIVSMSDETSMRMWKACMKMNLTDARLLSAITTIAEPDECVLYSIIAPSNNAEEAMNKEILELVNQQIENYDNLSSKSSSVKSLLLPSNLNENPPIMPLTPQNSEDNNPWEGRSNATSNPCTKSDEGSVYVPDQDELDRISEKSGGSHLSEAISQATSKPSEDEDFDNLSILRVAKMSKKGKKRATRMNWCVYCDACQSHFARHVIDKHSDEIEVAEINSKPKGSRERKTLLEVLRNRGNMVHNKNVLDEKRGVFKPVRRSKFTREIDDYLPCVLCKGFFMKSEILKHRKHCKSRHDNDEEEPSGRNFKASAAVIMHCSETITEDFKENVLNEMRPDLVLRTILEDTLILRFGQLQYTTNHGGSRTVSVIRNNMREVAKLLIEAKKLDSTISDLEQLFNVTKWPVVCEAVRNCAGLNPGHGKVTPSLAVKLAQHLQKLESILLADALQHNRLHFKQSLENFVKLRSIEWPEKVMKPARRESRQLKVNKSELLPLSEDIKLLTEYIKTNIDDALKKFRDGTATKATWLSLAKSTLARVSMFNRKRIGEVSNFLLAEYSKRQKGGGCNPEISAGLTKTEQFMYEKLTRVETLGKKFKSVPMLLTEEMVEAIDTIIATRTTVGGIKEENPYVFAHPGGGKKHRFMDGCAAFREMASKCGAKEPERLRGTRLRHHIATMSQLFNLGQYELEQLATFMGHNLDVHRRFYRLQESTIQVAKVSLILQALDLGIANKYIGKSLDEISFDAVVSDLAQNGDGDDETNEEENSLEQSEGPQTSNTTGCDNPTPGCSKEPNYPPIHSNIRKTRAQHKSVVKSDGLDVSTMNCPENAEKKRKKKGKKDDVTSNKKRKNSMAQEKISVKEQSGRQALKHSSTDTETSKAKRSKILQEEPEIRRSNRAKNSKKTAPPAIEEKEKLTENDAESTSSESELDMEPDCKPEDQAAVKPLSILKKNCNRYPWLEEEQEAIQKYFGTHLRILKRPTKLEITQALKAEKDREKRLLVNRFSRRSYLNVRDFINYRITKAIKEQNNVSNLYL